MDPAEASEAERTRNFNLHKFFYLDFYQSNTTIQALTIPIFRYFSVRSST
jgi:hypothetical protein